MSNDDEVGPNSDGKGRGKCCCRVRGYRNMPMMCCGVGRWSGEDEKSCLEQEIKILEGELGAAKDELAQFNKDKS